MTATKQNKQNRPEKPRRILRELMGGIIKLVLAVTIVGAAVLLYQYQMRTSPRAGRKKPPAQAKLVQVTPIRKDDCRTKVIADGIVMPAQQVSLRPQVTGQIIELSSDVVPGGIVKTGQSLMRIDHRDYEILVRQRQYDVARAEKDLKVEQGNQAVAQQEYELLDEVIAEEDKELVLREPQLASAEAAQASAKAAQQKAELDLARCDIKAPFNAIVREKLIDLGATVSLNSNLVTLIGTDEAWIEVKVPADKLKWLTIPRKNGDPGSSVKIYNKLAWGEDRFRTGRVLCLAGELETQGRLTRLLVAVDDPYCLKPENRALPQLLMGLYVSAEIEGRTLSSVFPIEVSYLRENDTAVWLMDDEGGLEVRPVQIAFRDPERVYITDGLTENEQLILTDIAAPVPGMPLRISSANEQTARDSRPIRQEGGR
jgi:RND family efflux transporter MFP subunit